MVRIPNRFISELRLFTHKANIALAAERQKPTENKPAIRKSLPYRDQLMGDIKGIVMASRDLLKGAYKKTPKKLGDWGFEVHDTPKAKKTTDGTKAKKVKNDQ